MLKNDLPASILYLSLSFLMIFSTSLTGSDPGDKMKKMGICGSESPMADPRISRKEDLESMSIYSYPFGRVSRMNLDRATVILSGAFIISVATVVAERLWKASGFQAADFVFCGSEC